MGAAGLDVHTYEEVEADPTAFVQAMGVVVLSSVAAGIGLGIRGGLANLILFVFASLISWFLWAFVTYFIGTRLLPSAQTHADWGQLLRTTGFSAAPGILRVFGFLPFLGSLVVSVSEIWMLAAFVIAVRQALDYTSTWRAVVVCIFGWIARAFILLPLYLLAR